MNAKSFLILYVLIGFVYLDNLWETKPEVGYASGIGGGGARDALWGTVNVQETEKMARKRREWTIQVPATLEHFIGPLKFSQKTRNAENGRKTKKMD